MYLLAFQQRDSLLQSSSSNNINLLVCIAIGVLMLIFEFVLRNNIR
jgi:hypothetical protein